MHDRVKITVTEGALAGEEYVFTGPTLCTVGRDAGCDLRPPSDPMHLTISRYHCVFDIDPPAVRVRDLGSRNGTHVNGKKIGQRDRNQSADPAEMPVLPALTLHDGDEVQVGSLLFRVEILPGADEASDCEVALQSQAGVAG
ncbi:MAG: FHA domain-containing protein [Gemmataceae bacterium]|nr:FHA domain-containing protein [Gemmataceae bacterium]